MCYYCILKKGRSSCGTRCPLFDFSLESTYFHKTRPWDPSLYFCLFWVYNWHGPLDELSRSTLQAWPVFICEGQSSSWIDRHSSRYSIRLDHCIDWSSLWKDDTACHLATNWVDETLHYAGSSPVHSTTRFPYDYYLYKTGQNIIKLNR